MKKTKEELLKIYSAYLPYELSVEWDSLSISNKFKLVGIDAFRNHLSLYYKSLWNDIEIDEIKPIIYSMDMLTKEIEHKRERFIPILEICKNFGLVYSRYQLNDNSVDLTLDKKYHRANTKTGQPQKVRFWFSNHKGISFNCTNMGLLMYKDIFGAVQKLLEWNFNVFGFDESEYIKKESLNRSENPNS